jgi:hypothetical protein
MQYNLGDILLIGSILLVALSFIVGGVLFVIIDNICNLIYSIVRK